MDKEEKQRVGKEGKDMQTVLNGATPSFADFLKSNEKVVREIVESNTVRNENDHTVITKNDSWRYELEWDE